MSDWSELATLPIFASTPLAWAMAAGTVALSMTVLLLARRYVWGVAAAAAWLERKRRRALLADRAAAGSLGIIGFVLNVVIWAMVVLLTLDNLGVDITFAYPTHRVFLA